MKASAVLGIFCTVQSSPTARTVSFSGHVVFSKVFFSPGASVLMKGSVCSFGHLLHRPMFSNGTQVDDALTSGTPTLHPAPYTLHPSPYTLPPTPYILHPTPYNLHPAPYTLQPTPYTLHPSPCTLHTTSHTLPQVSLHFLELRGTPHRPSLHRLCLHHSRYRS